MRNIDLITNKLIEGKIVNDDIYNNHPFSKVKTYFKDNGVFLGKYPREFYIYYDESVDIDSPDSMFYDEEKAKIPFRPAYASFLFFHHYDVTAPVVETIAKHYPELVVYDEEKDVFETAAEYVARIRKEFAKK